jgi:hypothetical protein
MQKERRKNSSQGSIKGEEILRRTQKVTLTVAWGGNTGKERTAEAEGTRSMVILARMMPGGTSIGLKGRAQTQAMMRVIVMTMRVGLKKTGVGRSTPSGEGIIAIRQGQTLKTTAVMKKSRNRPRKAILGAANAAINHQMMTLRTRPGPGR